MVLLGRFALEAGYSSSMAEVLKAAVDWIESLEMEGGPSPFWERPKAIVGWRGHHVLLGAFLQRPSHSPRKSPDGRTNPYMPPVFSSGGNCTLNFPRVKHQGSLEEQADKRVAMYRRTHAACGQL